MTTRSDPVVVLAVTIIVVMDVIAFIGAYLGLSRAFQ